MPDRVVPVTHGIHWMSPQTAAERELAELLELGPIAEHLMADWATQRKGRALWCVGKQIYKVQTVLHPAAAAFTYTNQAIDGAR